MLVKELALFLDAPYEGDADLRLNRVASLEDATPNDVSFVTKGRVAKTAADSAAGCLLVPPDYDNATARTIIRTRDPRGSAARAIRKLHPHPELPTGIHPTAVLGTGVTVGKSVYIGPLVSIGAGVHIGDHVSIAAGSVIGDYVHIGAGCILH